MFDFLSLAGSADTKASNFLATEAKPFIDGLKLKGKAGIYALYEISGDTLDAVYVGRTRNLAQRFRAHITPNHNSASFALKRTRHIHEMFATYSATNRRQDIAGNEPTRSTFLAEIAKIRSMQFRFFLESDPINQYLVELALTMKLNLPLDGFDSH